MTIEELVKKFEERPYMLDMGKGKLSKWLKCSPDQIKEAKKIIRNKKHKKQPKILIFDIETSPNVAFVWRFWNENVGVSQVISNWFMLSWAAKWLGDNKVYGDVLTPEEVVEQNDYRIMKSLWNLLDEADIIIAHNGDKFDIPKVKSRFIINNIPLPTPYKSIDTLKIARHQFGFNQNSLEALARLFGLDGKIHTDFELWAKCYNGDKSSLDYMLKYNKQDIYVLEEVYLKIRPYIANHPNVTLYMDMDKPRCTTCGSEHIYEAGEYTTQVNTYTTYRCSDCGAIAGRDRKTDKKNVLMPVSK